MPIDLSLAVANIVSPPVLFFALGLVAALARSSLTIPEAIAKGMSLYLMLAIGMKGGVAAAETGFGGVVGAAVLAGIVISAVVPLMAFLLLRATTKLDGLNAAAVAGHYGSISIVTFVAATQALKLSGVGDPGFMVAVAAAMEAPAIATALWLANRHSETDAEAPWREVLLNGSVVLLLGAFAIGFATGAEGLERVAPFVIDPFQGVLCLFLLDMGLIAGRGLITGARHLSPALVAFGLYMPVLGGLVGLGLGALIGLDVGGVALLGVLSASASYIAVPAAMRIALPEAKPAIYLTLSLAVTFPFNLTLGIPTYIGIAQALLG